MINYPQASPPQVSISGNRAFFNLPYTISKFTALTCKNRVEQSHTRISVEITPGQSLTASNQIVLLGRLQELNSAYACGLFGAASTWKLQRAVAGVTNDLAADASTITLQPGVLARYTFELNGSSLTCQLEHNGSTRIATASDAAFATGKMGIFFNASTSTITAYVDNLRTEVIR